MRRMIPQKDIEKLDSIKLLNGGTVTNIYNESIGLITPKGGLSLGGDEYTTLYGDISLAIGGDYSPAVGDYNYVLDIGADGFQFQHLNEDSEELETFVTFGEDDYQNIGLSVGSIHITNDDGGEGPTIYGDGTLTLSDYNQASANVLIQLINGNIVFHGLSNSDPGVEGALWNDNGVLKISAGS